MTRRQNERLNPLGLVVYNIRYGLHGTPRLAEYVYSIQMQKFADGDELVYPSLLRPQFGVTVEIGVAAAYLVVGDDLPSSVSDAVKHLEVVVRTAWSAVEQ